MGDVARPWATNTITWTVPKICQGMVMKISMRLGCFNWKNYDMWIGLVFVNLTLHR